MHRWSLAHLNIDLSQTSARSQLNVNSERHQFTFRASERIPIEFALDSQSDLIEFSIDSQWIPTQFSTTSHHMHCVELVENLVRIQREIIENPMRIYWEFNDNSWSSQFDILGWYLFCVRIRRGRRATGVLTVLPLWHGLYVGRSGVFRVPVPVLCFSFGFGFWAVC